MDVLDKINESFVDDAGRPLQNIRCGSEMIKGVLSCDTIRCVHTY